MVGHSWIRIIQTSEHLTDIFNLEITHWYFHFVVITSMQQNYSWGEDSHSVAHPPQILVSCGICVLHYSYPQTWAPHSEDVLKSGSKASHILYLVTREIWSGPCSHAQGHHVHTQTTVLLPQFRWLRTWKREKCDDELLSSATEMAQECFLCAMFPLQLLDVRAHPTISGRFNITHGEGSY